MHVPLRIFRETHDLGNWVVNFDELLDRRQLFNQGVRVIRYKQSATQGRNLIISSRRVARIVAVNGAPPTSSCSVSIYQMTICEGLADRLIQDANDVSGDIVLRAAKRGQSASELIGVVLSRHLVRQELGHDQHCGWYFLDDYSPPGWDNGNSNSQIFSLFAPRKQTDGTLRVNLVITEAKYIELENLAAKRKGVAKTAT